jgi:hypothetical protein
VSAWVLWGFHPRYADGVPIKLTGGTLGHCRAEQTHRVEREGDWTCAIYKRGAAPTGLREQAKVARPW